MLTQQEFESLLADDTKRITGDIVWTSDEFHSAAQGFRAGVQSEADWPLFVEGWWNPHSGKLTFTLVHRRARRIVGLDLGDLLHHNPSCPRKRGRRVACDCPHGTHKHRWTEEFKAEWAYKPGDITATWDQPLEVWEQFCAETKIIHWGILHNPEWQAELAL